MPWFLFCSPSQVQFLVYDLLLQTNDKEAMQQYNHATIIIIKLLFKIVVCHNIIVVSYNLKRNNLNDLIAENYHDKISI